MDVDVIIPVYNHERFVGEAIESALTQTVQPHQVIVVDDGSTDETAAVVRRFPVRYVHQTNAGPGAARNHALRLSTTPWVLFLDSDNRLLPRFIEKTTNAAQRARPDVGVVYTPARLVGQSSGVRHVDIFDKHLLADHNYIDMCALVRRAAIDAAGGFAADRAVMGLEDWDLWLSLIERGWRGQPLPEPLFEYRNHPGPRANSFDPEVIYPAIIARHPWLPTLPAAAFHARLRRKAKREWFGLRQRRATREQVGHGA